ncbi:unnamed protein product [Heterobilharzia americana]|nr:unnamed protein product [Heterobilharzia americana]
MQKASQISLEVNSSTKDKVSSRAVLQLTPSSDGPGFYSLISVSRSKMNLIYQKIKNGDFRVRNISVKWRPTSDCSQEMDDSSVYFKP